MARRLIAVRLRSMIIECDDSELSDEDRMKLGAIFVEETEKIANRLVPQ